MPLIGSTPGGLPIEKKVSYGLEGISIFFDNDTIIGDGNRENPFRVNTELFLSSQEFALNVNPLVVNINELNLSVYDLQRRMDSAEAESGFDPTSMPGWAAAPIGSRFVISKDGPDSYSLKTEENVVIAASFNGDGDVYFMVSEDMRLQLSGMGGTGSITAYLSNDGGATFPTYCDIDNPYQFYAGQVIKFNCSGTTSFLSITVARVG